MRGFGSAASSSRIHGSVTPSASAAKLARWMVEPSAIGSLERNPDLDHIACRSHGGEVFAELRRLGNPAVRNPTSAGCPRFTAASMAWEIVSRGVMRVTFAAACAAGSLMSLSPRPEQPMRMRAPGCAPA